MRAFESRLAHAGGVRKVVRSTGKAIAARARSNLAAHEQTGRASIVVEQGATDTLIILDDPASLSIEYGRGAYTRSDGRHVGPMEGLHVLGRAIRG